MEQCDSFEGYLLYEDDLCKKMHKLHAKFNIIRKYLVNTLKPKTNKNYSKLCLFKTFKYILRESVCMHSEFC
jgi:hypothetical protein